MKYHSLWTFLRGAALLAVAPFAGAGQAPAAADPFSPTISITAPQADGKPVQMQGI